MHARALRRVLEAALATTTLGGCCIFGRSYGPSVRDYLASVPTEERVLRAARPDSSLPEEVCREVCELASDDTLVGCWVARVHEPDAGASTAGAVAVQCKKIRPGGCDTSWGSGRDTRARRTKLTASPGVGPWLARAAQSERTAVRAFTELSVELASFGAPATLVRAAHRARRDEVRHARRMTRLARAHGARVPKVSFARTPPRTLADFALENAVEGCVRELFGAAVILHQSRAAAHGLRAAFAAIAEDETRHAALSLRIFRWCEGRLDPATRTRIHGAMARAVDELLEAWEERDAALGLPTETQGRALARSLADAIWASCIVRSP